MKGTSPSRVIRAVTGYGIKVPRWKVQSLIISFVFWKGNSMSAIVIIGNDRELGAHSPSSGRRERCVAHHRPHWGAMSTVGFGSTPADQKTQFRSLRGIQKLPVDNPPPSRRRTQTSTAQETSHRPSAAPRSKRTSPHPQSLRPRAGTPPRPCAPGHRPR